MANCYPPLISRIRRAFFTDCSISFARAFLGAIDAELDPTDAFDSDIADEYRDFAVTSLARHFENSKGYVYAAAYLQGRDVFKIGRTKFHPSVREHSLNTAGVLVPLRVAQAIPCHDSYFVERACHAALSGQQISKEFFQVPLHPLLEILQAAQQRDEQRTRLCLRYSGG